MNKLIVVISFFLISFVLAGCTLAENNEIDRSNAEEQLITENETQTEAAQIDVPPEHTIHAVQIGSIKMEADRFRLCKLEQLLSDISNSKKIKDEIAGKIERDNTSTNEYTSLILHKNNDEKEKFFFFFQNGEWYFEAEDGEIYYGEFFGDIVNRSEADGILEIQIDQMPSQELLKYAKSCDVLNMRYELATNVEENVRYGYSVEQSVEYAKEKMLGKWRLYQYAVSAGYELTDEEFSKIEEETSNTIKNASNYAELEAYYEAAELTYDEMQGKLVNILFEAQTIQNMQNEIMKEFSDGQDKIGDVECWDTTEYWNTYVSNVILPAMDGYDFSSYERQLKDAEDFYYENF